MKSYPYLSWTLTNRQLCDLELIVNGGFKPLNGFMTKDDYVNVIEKMRLSNGQLWPIPICLDVSENLLGKVSIDDKISLKNKEGFTLANLHIQDIWKPDLNHEANKVFGTNDFSHPGVNYLINKTNKIYIGGKVESINNIQHYDFNNYRHSPAQLKSIFKQKKWKSVIAFQTRNPLHRAHFEMTEIAIKELKSKLLIHPSVGATKPGDVDHFTRVRCYEHILKKYKKNTAFLSLLPLAMRMAGPKEALWHSIIRKNYGCTHMIVGRDHAGPGKNSKNKPFYDPFEAQDLILKHSTEIGIKMVPFNHMVYLPGLNKYKPIHKIKNKIKTKSISGTKLRSLLEDGNEIPEWFTFKEIANELRSSYPPLSKRGFTIFFTGLSGSGKSTLANALLIKLLEKSKRSITLLDGDIVRNHLSSELGFSKSHRSINVKRIGYVASEITKNGGIAICAPIAPYNNDRLSNRELISKYGGYIEVFVDTPLEKCEERDVKGLYRLARKGIIKEFTGISDPYEKPANSELRINSSGVNPSELVDKIFNKIIEMGYLK